jgi:hypothetical protein
MHEHTNDCEPVPALGNLDFIDKKWAISKRALISSLKFYFRFGNPSF